MPSVLLNACVCVCVYQRIVTYVHRVPYVSHLFEIKTASRTYLCGALTHEEMQSWVGILQTLTQYCGQQEIVGDYSTKGTDDEASDKENGKIQLALVNHPTLYHNVDDQDE